MRVSHLTESDVAAIPAAPTDESTPATTGGTHEYPISPEGRRQAIVLFLGVISLWVFAVWSIINLFEGGLGGVEWVSLVLMLGIALVAPVVGFALLEEANARIVTDEKGVRYRSLAGVDIFYEWGEITGFEQTGRRGRAALFFLGDDEPKAAEEIEQADDAEPEADAEPDTRLLHMPERTGQIKNPLARILHKLAHGSALPIYGGIADREALLADITSRSVKRESIA